MGNNPCVDVVVRELDAVRARHFIKNGGGRVHIQWTVPGRVPQVTIVPATPSSDWRAPQRARNNVRQQLKALGVLTEGAGGGIRTWRSDDPPLVASAPRTPVQLELDELAARLGQLTPFGRDPSRFASERSAIVEALLRNRENRRSVMKRPAYPLRRTVPKRLPRELRKLLRRRVPLTPQKQQHQKERV